MTCPFAASATKLEAIPQPPQKYFGLLGNLPDVDPSNFFESIGRLAKEYGPILKLWINEDHVFLSNQKFINEICDEDRFEKVPGNLLHELRPGIGDGLFTAHSDEENWGKAHRILMPAFSPLGIRKMFDDMVDLSSQLVLKWDRLGPANEVVVSDDMTRLAFDTLGLCAFSYRFNEFYSDNAHPFAEQMSRFLLETGKRSNRTKIGQQLHAQDERQRQADIKAMHALADRLVAERREHPQPDRRDYLNIMLETVDPKTGTKLPDENIRYNLVTLLIAGHETTSATLGFTYYYLLKNPDKLRKAQQEVDEVLGDKNITVDMLPKLTYLDACTKEALRLGTPVPTWGVMPKKDTVLDGRCPVSKTTQIDMNLAMLHRDPAAWGDDAEQYRPERFLNGAAANRPPNSFKPFGNGQRACIGRAFAEQEMLINLAMVLQRFHIELADPSYNLQIQTNLTRKPHDFRMRVRSRPGRSMYTGIPGGMTSTVSTSEVKANKPRVAASGNRGLKALILYGGNMGTCEGFAQELQTRLSSVGVEATIQSLDSATEHIPTDRPVLFITSSYEGKAPDNAKKFVSWLEQLKDADQFKGVKYSVMAVGNSDWTNTFHRIPKLVDEIMSKLGASRILDVASTNVKKDLVGPLEEWCDALCDQLTQGNSTGIKKPADLQIKIDSITPSGSSPGADRLKLSTIIRNDELAAATDVGYAKRHMDVQLPPGTSYTAGDYLVVAPSNSDTSVRRVTAHFGLSEYDTFSVQGSTKKHLPQESTPVFSFLSRAVELHNPVTRRQLEILSTHADPTQQTQLTALAHPNAHAALLEKRTSVLDLLETLHLAIPFAIYLDMLSPLIARQYSIASTPLSRPNSSAGPIVSICYDVHTSPSPSPHVDGVSSTYLSTRRPGERLLCGIRATNDPAFRLPAPSSPTPVIMVAAGTGIAPMRAFVAERAALADAAASSSPSSPSSPSSTESPIALAPMLLYHGSRDAHDALYAGEFAEWEARGLVEVVRAFSRPTRDPREAKGEQRRRYVQDAMWEDRERFRELWEQGAKVYVCGSAEKLGTGVKEVCMRIHREFTGDDERGAEEWLGGIMGERFVSDVY